MNLKVHSIDGKGKLENEVIWIDVVEAVDDLSNFLICDTTYTDDNHISNELRNVYWFPKKSVKKQMKPRINGGIHPIHLWLICGHFSDTQFDRFNSHSFYLRLILHNGPSCEYRSGPTVEQS